MKIQKCFLLSYVKFGDNDAVLHCFSEENGFQSFFAKGIYSAKNKKKPYLFPLNFLNITVSKPVENNTISRISKIELGNEYYDFEEISRTSILFFLADFLHQVLREEGFNRTIFDEINSVRKEISSGNSNASLGFLIRFLQISGLAPLPNSAGFLNPESGLFEPVISHAFFDENISQIWSIFLSSENVYAIRLKRNQRNEFLDSLMFYFQVHITGFYTPQSLAIVRQIFE
jgi:DNA repair protein RecO (recombination protein O)